MNLFYGKTHRICHPDNSNGNDDYMMDYNPLLLKSIENDVGAAKTQSEQSCYYRRRNSDSRQRL